jgi:hypothetical protein
MKGIAALLLVGILAGTAFASAPSSTGRTVPCNEVILATKWPYLGSRKLEHRYRTILDAVSVPPAYMQQVVPTGDKPWSHWRKQGVVVRATAPMITITVPKAWRTRAAIAWGYGGTGIHSSLRFTGCGSDPAVGNAYSGGFYLRAPSACVPLIFRVGGRTTTVRFGVGRRC